MTQRVLRTRSRFSTPRLSLLALSNCLCLQHLVDRLLHLLYPAASKMRMTVARGGLSTACSPGRFLVTTRKGVSRRPCLPASDDTGLPVDDDALLSPSSVLEGLKSLCVSYTFCACSPWQWLSTWLAGLALHRQRRRRRLPWARPFSPPVLTPVTAMRGGP